MVRADQEPGDQEGGWLTQKTDAKDCTGAVVMGKQVAERKERRNIQAAETGKGQWLLG